MNDNDVFALWQICRWSHCIINFIIHNPNRLALHLLALFCSAKMLESNRIDSVYVPAASDNSFDLITSCHFDFYSCYFNILSLMHCIRATYACNLSRYRAARYPPLLTMKYEGNTKLVHRTMYFKPDCCHRITKKLAYQHQWVGIRELTPFWDTPVLISWHPVNIPVISAAYGDG